MKKRYEIALILTAVLPMAGWAGGPSQTPSEDEEVSPRAPESRRQALPKRGSDGSRLLLPLYLVDTLNPQGPTTFFAVRNESGSAVEATIRYFETDGPQAPQHEDPITLGAKQIRTVDVRSVENLETDAAGIARGFVIIAATGGEAVLHGDYFQITGGEDFASGSRLVNIDPMSPDNDLCGRFSMRFLNSALFFDSGTTFTFWVDAAEPPAGNVFTYSVYNEAGTLRFFGPFAADEVAFQTTADDLLGFFVNDEFGALEFELTDGRLGHVSATLSAQNRFSVGFEATCLDN